MGSVDEEEGAVDVDGDDLLLVQHDPPASLAGRKRGGPAGWSGVGWVADQRESTTAAAWVRLLVQSGATELQQNARAVQQNYSFCTRGVTVVCVCRVGVGT